VRFAAGISLTVACIAHSSVAHADNANAAAAEALFTEGAGW